MTTAQAIVYAVDKLAALGWCALTWFVVLALLGAFSTSVKCGRQDK